MKYEVLLGKLYTISWKKIDHIFFLEKGNVSICIYMCILTLAEQNSSEVLKEMKSRKTLCKNHY